MAFDYIKARKDWAVGDKERDKNYVVSKDIDEYDNLQYGEDPIFNLLDIYRPKNNDEYLPIIISIHGGGWFYGDKELYKFYTTDLVSRGFAVVNFNYHLAPESNYPQPLKDILLVFDYIYKNKDLYKLDINNTFIVGDSAGAQLNYQINLMLSNKKYADLFDFKVENKLNIKAIALNCGCYAITIKPFKPTGVAALYLGDNYKKYKNTLDMSKYLTNNFPPAYVMSGYKDFLKFFAKPMAKKLKRKNVEHVFHLRITNNIAILCNNEETEFFKKYISK